MIVTDLDKLSEEVVHERDDHESVIERLREVHADHGGYGLAANQIGVYDSRTCLVDVNETILFVNPQIVKREGTTRTEEGCLSIPNVRLQTERNLWIEVEADRWYRSSIGEWNEIGGRLSFGPDEWGDTEEANESWKRTNKNYIESIAVQHEIDHLNGKTIYDREVQHQPFEKSELDKLGRNDKVYVKNADGEEFEVKWKYASKHDDWDVLEIAEE